MSVTVFDYDFADPKHPLNKFITRRKNLGWLIKHAKDVKNFSVRNFTTSQYSLQGYLNIKCKNKSLNQEKYGFLIKFNDPMILMKFLNRKIFRNLPLLIDITKVNRDGKAQSVLFIDTITGSNNHLKILKEGLGTQKNS